jgi:ACT domain-containing protein
MTSSEIAAKETLLESIRDTIEKMSKTQHIDVLRIFKKFPHVKLNQNKSGIFINLSFCPDDVITELSQFITYVNEQEQNLLQIESKREEFERTFFS